MQPTFGTTGSVELRYDILDLLERVTRSHQYGILRFDDGEILYIERRHQTAGAVQVAILCTLNQNVTGIDVTFSILVTNLIERLPCPEVAPARAHWADSRLGGVFHHSVVNGKRRGGYEGLPIWEHSVFFYLAMVPCFFDCVSNVLCKAVQFVEIDIGAHEKDAAIPVIITFRKHAGGVIRVGLFYKTVNNETRITECFTASDVAITGLRGGWRNTEGHDTSRLGQRARSLDGCSKCLTVTDGMVGRHDENKRICALIGQLEGGMSSQCYGRSRIARCRFKKKQALHTAVGQTFGSIEAVCFITDNK